MWNDFIINRSGGWEGGPGEVSAALGDCRFDVGLMRPFIDERGRKVCTVNTGRKKWDPKLQRDVPVYETLPIKTLDKWGVYSPVFNATTLRKDEWIMYDTAVVKIARAKLRAWADLAAANTLGGFDGMSKLVLEHETMNDPGLAMVDLDMITEGRTDSPKYQLEGLPLPITHSDFWFSERRLRVSRNSGTPLDTTMAECAARRIVEMVERTVIGTETGMTYGTSTNYSRTSAVYGYTNFPLRLTKTNLTTPTGSNPEATVSDVLSMLETLRNYNFDGPFMIYHSTDWDKYLDNDYARLGGNNASQTLRARIKAIDGIADVRRLSLLSSTTNPFTLIVVQMTAEVARAVIGMPLQVFQWESQGGWRKNFKAACIYVPQLRADQNGITGILHATTS